MMHDLVVVALEIEKTKNILMSLHNVVEILKQSNQVHFACVSSYEKLKVLFFIIVSLMNACIVHI